MSYFGPHRIGKEVAFYFEDEKFEPLLQRRRNTKTAKRLHKTPILNCTDHMYV